MYLILFFVLIKFFIKRRQVYAIYHRLEEAERVGKYMIRPLLSLKRLFFDETEGKVRYQYSRQGSQEERMDYLEFIARVTSHIPDKGKVMARYYGLYSNAHPLIVLYIERLIYLIP